MGMTPAPSPVRLLRLIFVVMIQTLGCRILVVISSFDAAGGCVELYCTSPAWALGGFGVLGDDWF